MRNLVDGLWKDTPSKRSFKSINPSDTRDVVGSAPRSSKKDVDEAIGAAQEAQSGWRRLPQSRRASHISKLSELLESSVTSLGDLLSRESGMVRSQAHESVRRIANYAASLPHRTQSQSVHGQSTYRHVHVIREPAGVVGIVPTWQDPLLTLCRGLLPALFVGNTVVIKACENVPCTTSTFVEMLLKTGIPQGVVNLLHGPSDVAAALASHKDINAMHVETDEKQCQDLTEKSQKNGKPCIAICPRSNISILTKDFLNDEMPSIIDSCIWMNGQSMDRTHLLLVHNSKKDEVIKKLKEDLAGLVLGSALDSRTKLGPLINENVYKRFRDQSNNAKRKEKPKLIYEGMNVIKNAQLKHGHFHDVILLEGNQNMQYIQETIHGPLITLISYENEKELMKILSRPRSIRTISMFGNDIRMAHRINEMVYCDIITMGVPSHEVDIHLSLRAINGMSAHTDAWHLLKDRSIITDASARKD